MRSLLVVLALALAGGTALAQAPEVPAPSPKARVEQRVGITDFSVDYSSPGVKGRKVFGDVVKLGELWRTGANAATKLMASRDFVFGDKPVTAGSYAIFTIPTKDSWTVILNTDLTGGTSKYSQKNDVARITVKPTASPMRERLAFIFSDTTDEATRLDLEWDKVRVSIPLRVDTKAFVMASIDKSLADAWRPHFAAARWLLDSNGDLDRAMGYIDASIAIQQTWWNNWVRGQILAKKGQAPDAIVAAEKAVDLGKGDYVFENFFKTEVAKSIEDWKKKKKT